MFVPTSYIIAPVNWGFFFFLSPLSLFLITFLRNNVCRELGPGTVAVVYILNLLLREMQ